MNQPRRAPSIFDLFGQRKMAALLLLGFSSGMPLYLTSKTLQAWMTVEGVDLSTVGKVSWLALPYSLKFLWAPILDRYVPPFLGRRRGWLLITQVMLGLLIAGMALHDPRDALFLMFINTVLIAFFSATQDIAVDAYGVDVLEEREMGAGASLKVMGYRIAMILTGGLALVMANSLPWATVYVIMGAFMLVGVLGTLMAPEPVLREGPPATLASAVVHPFMEFFRRAGPVLAPVILLFTVLYSLSDRLVQNMANPFLLAKGYTLVEIGTITQALGLAATIVGVVVGGVFVAKLGINRSLWVLAFIQMGSNLAYYMLAVRPKSTGLLTGAILVENFSGGLVTAGFVAFLMSLSSRQFSATQYALLSSLMAFGRDFIGGYAGDVAQRSGWPGFFLISIAAGIPALLLLPIIAPLTRENPRGAAEHTGEVTDDPDLARG
ncbi:MAG TPA: AmpG family muropeptide MFS transporter [Longimicrobium sp.]|uniref:AmpG family muropeptide MFS transporter n=1 Tax=Longimicrobium sp. TaxID=2029185 RepID=UPI002ED844DB